MEYKLSDKTRIDCLTDGYAIEVDWAKKWAEGVGKISNKFNIKIYIISKEN